MEESEEEKMRRRREKAAAWAAGRAEPMAIEKSQPSSADQGGRGAVDEKESAPRDWRGWAQQVSTDKAGGAGAAADGGGYGWRNMVGGLQTLAGSFGMHNSAAVKQAEEEAALDSLDDDYFLPMNHRPTRGIDMSRCVMATMDRPIPEDNLGHRMLLRLGWKGHGGLGPAGRGICDPIPITSKDLDDITSRVGVGKSGEENQMHVVATEKRKDLESEIQVFESEDRRRAREEKVLKETVIREEVKEIVRLFYCDICDKQYTTDGQYQEHLNSYDHHHKKRFAEFQMQQKAMKGGPSKDERLKK
eukprot:CAMPEP_0172186330 /NCGR_PEP_ID=MMETSP1050-20130122/20694_1 /TAXON_ID=233186 /ORGANISM="Cryptomonas curvata, Strain CCAP979/52" /LENGTH=302 /DNA_ID=CAMNT_0012860473 /DNA_START=86 /DNA_END=991 /DNA_ORIENTATION=-